MAWLRSGFDSRQVHFSKVDKKTKAAISQLEYLKKLAPKELQLAAEWKKKWKILISTILSSQTKDETTIK